MEAKDALVKKDMEAKDILVKADMERRAETLKHDTESLAQTIKTTAEDKAAIVKEEIAMTARLLKESHQTSIAQVLDRIKEVDLQIKEVDSKQMRMLGDLSKRADMTNGNVASIRQDTADLSQDIEELFTLMEEAETTALGGGKPNRDIQLAVSRRKRSKNLTRRTKRKEIEHNSQTQADVKDQY